MPRDGSGNYTLPSGNPVVTNTIISSSGWANPTLSDLASALTQSLSRDGQTTPTADLTMGNFKLRNLAAALARTDAVNAGQVQDGGLTFLGTASGTDTITATSAPAITAYVAGQRFAFISAGANTTNAVTLNINAIGAKNVTKNGTTALAPGDIPAGAVMTVVYDGTQFQIGPILGGRYIGTQTFASSGTYTPTVGATIAVVELQAAGGGGGGAVATGAGQFSIGAGGGAGGYIRTLIANPVARSVTVGGGGAGVSGGQGGTGGASGFGPTIAANGGTGGQGTPAAAAGNINGGAGGASTISGNLANIQGGAGAPAWTNTSIAQGVTGAGGSSLLGNGAAAQSVANVAGLSASGSGAGGSGAFNAASQSARAGGAGSSGYVLVHEYI